MLVTVDVCLRQSSINLVRQYMKNEEIRSNGNKYSTEDIFETVIKAIRNAIQRRVGASQNCNGVLTFEDIFRDGKGSISIQDPPTQAQENIILSLIKVIFHSTSTDPQFFLKISTHDNMILSLFVKVVYLNKHDELDDLKLDNVGLHEINHMVNKILTNQVLKHTQPIDKVNDNDRFEIYFYILAAENHNEQEKLLTTEFDKFSIVDSYSNDDESTYNEFSLDQNSSYEKNARQTQSIAHKVILPCPELEGVWENLYYNKDIKIKLLNYSTASLRLAWYLETTSSSTDVVNEMISANNKMILLHGPPGTGKTTLCKALCNKLAIRMAKTKNCVVIDQGSLLYELSCSRVFSRWFGESSKNITQLFRDIEADIITANKHNNFVFLLIDEVETIATSRINLSNKNETSDSVRVVNSLLTHLDKLKRYPNFLVLATSNLLETLDTAFVDRADGVFFIGNPTSKELKYMINSSIDKLIKTGVIVDQDSYNLRKYDDVLQLLANFCEVCIKKTTYPTYLSNYCCSYI